MAMSGQYISYINWCSFAHCYDIKWIVNILENENKRLKFVKQLLSESTSTISMPAKFLSFVATDHRTKGKTEKLNWSKHILHVCFQTFLCRLLHGLCVYVSVHPFVFIHIENYNDADGNGNDNGENSTSSQLWLCVYLFEWSCRFVTNSVCFVHRLSRFFKCYWHTHTPFGIFAQKKTNDSNSVRAEDAFSLLLLSSACTAAVIIVMLLLLSTQHYLR